MILRIGTECASETLVGTGFWRGMEIVRFRGFFWVVLGNYMAWGESFFELSARKWASCGDEFC